MYVVSIPHTWTRKLIALLDTTHYHHVHAEGTWQRVKEAEIVIAPIRKPESVWQSWWRREKYSRVTCPKCGPQDAPTDEFWGCWMLMDKYDREREILYVPIDHPDRDAYWDRMCSAIGRKLDPQWSIASGHEDSDIDGSAAPAVDLSLLYGYDFVRRIYGNRH